MEYWIVSDWLFYGGIAVMAGVLVIAVISMIIFKLTGKKIKAALKKDYGDPYNQ